MRNVAPILAVALGCTILAPTVEAGAEDGGRAALAKVRECWVIDPEVEAGRIVVTIGLDITPDGHPVAESLALIRASRGSAEAVELAYQAARRAILRCGARGLDLPPKHYESWRHAEITFDPRGGESG